MLNVRLTKVLFLLSAELHVAFKVLALVVTQTTSLSVALVEKQTQQLLDWAARITDASEFTYLQRSQILARRLGAHWQADTGLTEIGFWTPELAGEVIQSDRQIYLEVLTPLTSLDFRQKKQTLKFQRDCIRLPLQGEFIWGVIEGMKPGRRDQAGSFYWLRFVDIEGRMHTIRDPLAYSVPYGVFGPAELYDIDRLQKERPDLDYFRQTGLSTVVEDAIKDTPAGRSAHTALGNGAAVEDHRETVMTEVMTEDDIQHLPRIPAPVNILQIHINTASEAGTLEGLTAIYQRISDKLAAGEDLTPDEIHYVGYDAVQFLPLEPTIEYRLEDVSNVTHEFFAIHDPDEHIQAGLTEDPEVIEITLRKSKTQNWGYDVPILASSATNPAVMGSLRPDELVDLTATLHNFSQGPIQVIYDLVYGHADNQCLELLSRHYLKGPNMYGQDLNHQLPGVRAILLEMQRRKINTGADGIRVDGGQDFRYFNPMTGRVEQDDAYLLAMSDVVQEVNGYQRLLFTIFEDGRPWPEEGWEETSTYRELIELRPESYQWGPLIFAHNTPTLNGFWDRKWRRVCEVMYQGDRWITGCANHDTVRRGNQVDTDSPVNWNLGNTLPEVLRNAYQNPAILLWVYGFSPGLPMDFLNASFCAPWGFFRNTDDRYGVKVVSEEVGFLDWQIEPDVYQRPETFPQIKQLGFSQLDALKQFAKALHVAMTETDYDLEAVAEMCQRCIGEYPTGCEMPSLEEIGTALNRPEFLNTLDVHWLKKFAMAFMEDGHELCKVSHYRETVQPQQSQYLLGLRRYRQANPWLRDNLTGLDRFNRVSDDQRTIFYGLRSAPVTHHSHDEQPRKQVVFVAHMGGDPTAIALADWLQLDLSEWRVTLATPGVEIDDALKSHPEHPVFELYDGQGVLFERQLTANEN